MTDFETRRKFMVDTQIRPSDVTKFPIIDACMSIPREKFVPTSQVEAAYIGENIPLADGRVLLEPRTLAKILDALSFDGSELVLDVGCGYGYSSAIIARLAAAVVAIDANEDFISEAQTLLPTHNIDNVIVEQASLTDGAPEHGPYDVIIIQGGVETVPEALEGQLKEGGRIAAIFMEDGLGVVRIGLKTAGVVHWRYAFNASAPVIAGFVKEKEFVFL